jgi:four helix bundle protein
LVRSAYSISANLAEGYGRFFYKENRQFCYCRGSLYETKTWPTKAHNRKLLNDPDFQALQADIKKIAFKLNNYINLIEKRKNNNNPQESQ